MLCAQRASLITLKLLGMPGERERLSGASEANSGLANTANTKSTVLHAGNTHSNLQHSSQTKEPGFARGLLRPKAEGHLHEG